VEGADITEAVAGTGEATAMATGAEGFGLPLRPIPITTIRRPTTIRLTTEVTEAATTAIKEMPPGTVFMAG
jgi:hypothetical protein